MKKNMSRRDGLIRLVVAAIIISLYFVNAISGTVAIVLGVIALVFAVTGVVNFCPLYAALGIRTKKS